MQRVPDCLGIPSQSGSFSGDRYFRSVMLRIICDQKWKGCPISF